MQCRRCYSSSLLLLNRKHPKDNYIIRCRDCGFLFSPPLAAKQPEKPKPGAPGAGQA